ncbi:MAG: hypothetical protein KIH67_003210 [Candidatus Moranbacteria bacterium]|nr:hypothetical protein [Candidatus Moranbacteria bacterium]
MAVSGTTRYWGKTAQFLALAAREKLEYISKIYRNAMPYFILGPMLLFGFGVWLNVSWDAKELNAVIMFILMAAWAYFTFHPKPLALILALGGIRGLPDIELEKILKEFNLPNFQLGEVAKSAVDQFKGYVGVISHIFLFWITAFAVLTLFKLEHGWPAMGALVFLGGVGLWSLVYKAPPKIYKVVTGVILTFGFVALVVAGYRYTHPQDRTTNRIERALMERDDARKNARAEALLARIEAGEELTDAQWDELNAYQAEREEHGMVAQATGELTYEVTREVVTTSTAMQKVCGIRPGNRTFTIPTVFVSLGAEAPYELTGYVRINGVPGTRSPDGRSFSGETRVRGDGCVRLTFGLDRTSWKRQTLALVFN